VRSRRRRRAFRTWGLSTGSINDKEAFLDTFGEGLRELGYVDGKNIIIDARWAGDMPGQFSTLAASLVRDRANAIVTTCVPSTRAAKGAFFATQLASIVAQAERQRVPAVYGFDEFTEAGGLMSYGISFRMYDKSLAR
jgi:hypothetical protein